MQKSKLSRYRQAAPRGRGNSSYSFLTSALDGVSGQLYPCERTPGTHRTGGWVGLRAGLGTEATGKILCLCRDWTPVVQSLVRDYTDWEASFILKNIYEYEKQIQSKQIPYMRFYVITAASMKFSIVFWDVLPCKIIVDHWRQLFYTAVHPRRQFWTKCPIIFRILRVDPCRAWEVRVNLPTE
jgi:hypothetical protein